MTFGTDTTTLVRRARDHDALAWEEIVSRFHGLVATIAHAHGLRAADTGDVAQTTWLRLYQSIDRLRDPERLGSWISTTARRECMRMRRAQVRELPTEDVAANHESHVFPAPDMHLVSAEERETLWSAVGALSGRHHDLMALLLTTPTPAYADISRRLDIAVGSIGPTRMRVIERLRSHPEIAALAC